MHIILLIFHDHFTAPLAATGQRGFAFVWTDKETAMPALIPALLPLLPAGLGALAALATAVFVYVLTQRSVEARLLIR